MESFSQPSIKLAAAGLALIALIAFAMGFKGSFVRPSEAAGHYPISTEPASSMGEPTQAQALTEPLPTSAAEPAPPSAAPKPKPKPATVDDEGDNIDAAAQPEVAKPASSAPASSATPQIVTPPKLSPKATTKVTAPAKAPSPSSKPAPASSKPSPESIDDLLPPH